MFAYDNGRVNVLAENRCANTSMYRYFNIPAYSFHSNQNLVDIWKSNPSQKIVVLRHPYQRVRSAIAYHDQYSKKFYQTFKTLSKKEQKQNFPELFEFYNWATELPYQVFRKQNIRNHCNPYMRYLVGLNFKFINFEKIYEYLDVKDGPITNTKDKSFSNNFLEFHDLEILEFEKKIYDDFLLNKEEISPEEWKSLTT
jgi:hypothetical protein